MPSKLKEVELPVLELVKQRWSPVLFSDEPVDERQLRILFEAARWAPSCYNEQPWSFVLGVKGKGETHAQILSTLVKMNQEWAEHAPVLGVSVASRNFARNQKPNRHCYHDVGLAMGQLILQATALELEVHQMAGFDVEKAKEVLEVPEGCDPVAAFAIGHLGSLEGAPESLQKRDTAKSTRKSQSEFLFLGTWGKQF